VAQQAAQGVTQLAGATPEEALEQVGFAMRYACPYDVRMTRVCMTTSGMQVLC